MVEFKSILIVYNFNLFSIGQDVFVRDSNLQFSMEKKKSNEN